MNFTRRSVLAGSLSAIGVAVVAGCGGSSNGGEATEPSPTPTPTPSPSPSSAPPTTRLVLWGDSRTQGIGGVSPDTFADYLTRLLPGVAVTNAGRSGQTAAEVIARQGGAPTRLTLAGSAIPGTGAVEVVAASVSIFSFALNPAAPGSIAGSLAGVPGTYEADGTGRQRFIRTAPGPETPVPANTPFLTDLGERSRDATMFLCVGENGVQVEPPESIVALTQAAVDHLIADRRRYVIAGVMPDLTATTGAPLRPAYDRLNSLLRSRYGRDYLDLPAPPTDAEMAAIGFAPSAEDRTDIAAGVYPRGMFQDAIHLRGAGQHIWARRLHAHLATQGAI